MTLPEILTTARHAGIRLEARGELLHVEAPPGTVTPAFRAELARHKPALLTLLAPVTEFVSLKGGLVVPVPALLLALDLERRGFRLSLDALEHVMVEPGAALTDVDQAGLRRWRLHLGAIVAYNADAYEGVQ